MKKKLNPITIALILLSFLILPSCMVSKKKYVALGKAKEKSIDSLNKILNENIDGFNKHTNQLSQNNTQKNTTIDSLTNEIKRLASDTSAIKQNLRDAIADYKAEKNKLLALTADQTKKMDSLTLVLGALEEMIAKNKAEVDKLNKVISDALNSFDKSELTVYSKNGKVYIALEEKLMFKTGSSTVDKKGEDALKKIALVLEKTENIDIAVEGHTDNKGSAELNWDLSAKRALSVVNILQKNSTTDPKRFTASGRGMYMPSADNTTEDGRAKNRRIEIILSPKMDILYKMLDQ